MQIKSTDVTQQEITLNTLINYLHIATFRCGTVVFLDLGNI